MKITVKPEIYAEAKIDLSVFEKEMKKTFHMENSLERAIVDIQTKMPLDKRQISQLIRLGIDWGTIIRKMPETTERIMNVRICPVIEENFEMFIPGISDGHTFEFKKNEMPKETLIVIQDFIPGVSFNLKNHLMNRIFNFSIDKTWKQLIQC